MVEFDAADVLGGIKDIPAEKNLVRVSFFNGTFMIISKRLDYPEVNLHWHLMIHGFSSIKILIRL